LPDAAAIAILAVLLGRALALLNVADDAQGQGNSLAIVDSDLNALHRLVGIF